MPPHHLLCSRRRFLELFGGAAVGTQLPAPLAAQVPLGPNPALPIPPSWSSTDGILSGVLEVAFSEFEGGGGQTAFTRTYAGQAPGPTLRLQPGDTIALTIANHLPPNPDGDTVENVNLPHQWNTTNLHTHGLHVSPKGNGDNVFLRINPAESFDYSIRIPDDHPGGLFWYHPHKHGGVHQQTRGGMAGALIIAGPLDEVPEVQAAKEVVMVLQVLDVTYNESFGQWEVAEPDPQGTTVDDIFPFCASLLTVNGLTAMTADPVACTTTEHDDLLPVITMQPGEVQRWRILNGSSAIFMPLEIVKENTGEAQSFAALSVDGLTFASPLMTTERLLTSGNRLELLFKPDSPGVYYLNKQEYAHSSSGPSEAEEAHRLVKIVVEGPPLDMPLPTELPTQVVNISPNEVQTFRELTFSIISGNPPSFRMNGLLFDPNRIDYVVPLGAVEEWTIFNPSDDDHNFHIHQNPFMVSAVNRTALPTPVWYDTFNVTRSDDASEGSVTLRMRFEDFLGKFVTHCHLLDHEELGMMQIVQVAEYINPIRFTQNHFVIHYTEGVHERDRFQLCGYLDLAAGQGFPLPFEEDVVINVIATNPGSTSIQTQLPVLTSTIPAGTVRPNPRLYHYTSYEPGIRNLLFRPHGPTWVNFQMTVGRIDFLPEERDALTPAEFRDLVEAIRNMRVLVSIGDNVWQQDIAVAPRPTARPVVILDKPRPRRRSTGGSHRSRPPATGRPRRSSKQKEIFKRLPR